MRFLLLPLAPRAIERASERRPSWLAAARALSPLEEFEGKGREQTETETEREAGWLAGLDPSVRTPSLAQLVVEGERLLNFELTRRRWNRRSRSLARSPSHWSSAVKKFSEKAGPPPLLADEISHAYLVRRSRFGGRSRYPAIVLRRNAMFSISRE